MQLRLRLFSINYWSKRDVTDPTLGTAVLVYIYIYIIVKTGDYYNGLLNEDCHKCNIVSFHFT